MSRNSWVKRILPPVDPCGMLASMFLFQLIFLLLWHFEVSAESAAFGFAVVVLLITIATLEISRDAGAVVRYIQDWCFTFLFAGACLVLLAQCGRLGPAESTIGKHLIWGLAYVSVLGAGIATIALMALFAAFLPKEGEGQEN